MKQLSNPPKRSFIRQVFERFDTFQFLGLVIFILFVAGLLLDGYGRIWGGPQIVVYLDKDAKQPAILPLPETQVVAGDRAALWWTVFNKSLEHTSADSARYIANTAVDSVYGPPKTK